MSTDAGREGWPEVERFDVVEATFRPKRTGNLRPELVPLIGLRWTWEVYWIQEEGDSYEGQWVLMPRPMRDDFGWWVPQEDLVDVRLIELERNPFDNPSPRTA